MKFQKILKSSLFSNKDENITTIAIVAGVAIGATIGVLLATKKGRAFKEKVAEDIIGLFRKITGQPTRLTASALLGNLIVNVHDHAKLNADGLLV